MSDDPRESFDDLGPHAPDTTGPISPSRLILEQVTEMRHEQRQYRRESRDDIAAVRADLGERMHRVEAHVAVLISNYQQQGVRTGEHMAGCLERHRHDTHEAQAADARADELAARLDAQVAAMTQQASRLVVLESTGVALRNWRTQSWAMAGVVIAALAAALAALVQFVG